MNKGNENYEEYLNMTEDIKNEYWKKCLVKRQPLYLEVLELREVAIANYIEYLGNGNIDKYSLDFFGGLLSFVRGNKRPYGSKDVVGSIVYNLKWDFNRTNPYLPYWKNGLPIFIREEAKKVHRELLKELKTDYIILEIVDDFISG